MCGLAGYALDDPRGEPDAERLHVMTSSLAHRGPDDESTLVRAPFALGFRRLSIIDVEGGRQPILSADGKVAVAGNGEIYNFRELRTRLEAAGHVFRTGSDIETTPSRDPAWVCDYSVTPGRPTAPVSTPLNLCLWRSGNASDWRQPYSPSDQLE